MTMLPLGTNPYNMDSHPNIRTIVKQHKHFKALDFLQGAIQREQLPLIERILLEYPGQTAVFVH